MRKPFFYLLTSAVVWFVFHTLYISIDGLTDDFTRADVALIYGNKVEKNGQMSARLTARVNKGLELYKTGLVKKLVVSGGLGNEGFYEAQVMKKYLVQNGVDVNDIIADDFGTDTYNSTVSYSQISKENHFTSVIIVSQFYHITRARMALKKSGVNEVYSAHAEYFEWRDLYSLFREFFGFYKYALLPFKEDAACLR